MSRTVTVDRRQFLEMAAAALSWPCPCRGVLPPVWAPRDDTVVTRVTAYLLEARRDKHIGANAQKADHGDRTRDTVLRIETNRGIEGWGPSRANAEAAATLIGRHPIDFFVPGGPLASPLGVWEAPLWDLIGKLAALPVWRLMGARGSERVAVYDSSFYFSDLDPTYQGRGVDRILEELDLSLAAGHRAFKLKVGRGLRWMEREEGIRRDIEVVRAARRHVGPRMLLMADANDAYDPVTARRLLDEADADLRWIEEPFRENVETDLAFKEYLRDRHPGTLLADGESVVRAADYDPFIASRALDVLQGNVHSFGMSGLWTLSYAAARGGLVLAPNNWESLFGFFEELVLGRAVPNLLMAELDPATTEAVDVSDFALSEGRCTVPDRPGCGWVVRPEVMERVATRRWRVP